MTETNFITINGRYQLQSELGHGGMGIVHRALDKLTGDTIALKQVHAVLQQLQFMSKPETSFTNDLRLALVQEFQTLATLRHPNIISVLDFGFTTGDAEQRHPFYTMDYLSQAETLLQATKELSVKGKIDCIEQILQGLAYLHRRGILHRDLKPENILVAAGQVRLLDFGLAIHQDETSLITSGGSLAYISPELWAKKPASHASDLYAVGVIAFELLADVHPFGPLDSWFTIRVVNEEPDWELLKGLPDIPDELVYVVQKLLVKESTARYQHANEVIADLHLALGKAESGESVAIRESYLQAADFVGREAEMALLGDALEQAQSGPGAVWLIAGESGVGKSRLIEEVRARALVAGWQVLTGHTAVDGGVPYQLWQEIIPRLVLNTALSDLELGILRQAAPAVDKLLSKPIPEPPTLSGEANQQRLVLTLTAVLQRQTQPTLLILEDLQWANESLAPIKELLRIQEQISGVMVLATFRDDEEPQLPAEIAGSQLIQLKRLPDEQIAKLGQAMLGEKATTPQIISLLVQETEGNTFFIVEVMRALAEEAGQLEEIGSMELPTDVFTSGMKFLLQRRIRRVPAGDQPLLQLAAVAGQVLDLALLQALAETLDVEDWLQRVSETAVLTVRENQWLFAHDKLREATLVDLSDEKRRQLHRQVAEAIEKIYPDNKAYFESLIEHWHQAGDLDKEVYYIPAGYAEIVYRSGDYERATSLSNRSLMALSEDDPRRVNVLARQVYTFLQTGELAKAQAVADEALELGRKFNNQPALALILRHMGLVKTNQGAFDEALTFFEESNSIYEAVGDAYGLAINYNAFGNIAHFQGQLQRAIENFERSLAYHQTTGDQNNIGRTLSSLGLVAADMDDWDAAEDYLQQSLEIFKQIGDKVGTAGGFINLGFVKLMHDPEEAKKYFYEALVICHNIQLIMYLLETMVGIAWLYEGQGDLVEAAELVGLLQHHPATNSDVKWRLTGLPEKLAAGLEPDELEAALERGRASDVNKFVGELIETIS
ncbi:MAG: tetratricopeptide repeat protein [Candidatus Promineifilaceae bacterium]